MLLPQPPPPVVRKVDIFWLKVYEHSVKISTDTKPPSDHWKSANSKKKLFLFGVAVSYETTATQFGGLTYGVMFVLVGRYMALGLVTGGIR